MPRRTERVRWLDDVEQEASTDDELSLDELRLSDLRGSNLAFELDWGQIFASERRRTMKGARNRSKGAPVRSSRPDPAATEPQFPALPSRHTTVSDGANAAPGASASVPACYACLGCGCDACLSSSPAAWRGAGSTRAALREAVAAMDDGRDKLEPRRRLWRREPCGNREDPRDQRSRAPARRRPAPQIDGASDALTPGAVLSKGAARRLIGKRSHSIAQVRQQSVRQARRTAEAAGSWELQPRLVSQSRPQAVARLAAANQPLPRIWEAASSHQLSAASGPVRRAWRIALGRSSTSRAVSGPQAGGGRAVVPRCWFQSTGSSRECSHRAR